MTGRLRISHAVIGRDNMNHFEERGDQNLTELVRDPSLLLAFGTGTTLTVFLLVAHSCCLGLSERHLAPLLQICSFAG